MAGSRRPFRLFVAIGALAAAWGLFVVIEWGVSLLRQPPPFTLSRQTTGIVEPLAPDGLPDWFRAALDAGPPAIPAASNAAAAVWEVLADAPSGNDAVDHSRARLTLADRRPAAERFDPRPVPPDGVEFETVRPIVAGCLLSPWRASDLPWLAAWIDRNASPLDVVAEGARRDGWCPPRCLPAGRAEEERSGDEPLLLSMTLPVEGVLTGWLGTALHARAMLRLGENDPSGAWNDFDVLLRYGDKMTDIVDPSGGRLVIQRLNSRTARGVQRLVCSSRLDDAQLADIQRSLRSVADWSPLAASMEFERLMVLEAIAYIFANPSRPLADAWWAKIVPVDREALFTAGNREIDRLVTAVAQPTRADRLRAIAFFNADRAKRRAEPIPRRAWFQPSYQVFTEAFDNSVFDLVLPDPEPLVNADDRARTELLLADTAAAIERHRLRVGRPPATLDELVPAGLSSLPIDPFTDRPLGYRVDEGGWTLWSREAPGADDAGSFVRWPPATTPDTGATPERSR